MFSAAHIPYNQANAFTRIVTDYLSGATELRPFYASSPNLQGIRETIDKKKQQPVNRKLLVQVLEEQYTPVSVRPEVKKNIELLRDEKTFTICTAHQPNLFTGPLYFIFKILHTIRLAAHLNEEMPGYHFVPVYYMGSEDADFAELNHTFVDGKKIEWLKEQRGAVGRMIVDRTLIRLIDELEGQLSQESFGKEVIVLLRNCYSLGKTIQAATFELVNELYGNYGLVVIIPDHAGLKGLMKTIFADDLFHHRSSEIVRKTSGQLEAHYEAQAYPRDINLFYLKDDIRERIERKDGMFYVLNTTLVFSEQQMKEELENYPERFSPNVILRGIFQETMLPNLVFIGGGGELAYWLQLKDLFQYYNVVYPVLVLRNSFLVIEKKWMERIRKTGLSAIDFFSHEDVLMKKIIEQHSEHPVTLNGNFEKLEDLFLQLNSQASVVDPTLTRHVAAIRARSIRYLEELEKKMIRAGEKKICRPPATDPQNPFSPVPRKWFTGTGREFQQFLCKVGK